jgi:hypothetical protein
VRRDPNEHIQSDVHAVLPGKWVVLIEFRDCAKTVDKLPPSPLHAQRIPQTVDTSPYLRRSASIKRATRLVSQIGHRQTGTPVKRVIVFLDVIRLIDSTLFSAHESSAGGLVSTGFVRFPG